MNPVAQAWAYTLARVAGLAALGVLLGLMLGSVIAGLLVMLSIALTWQLFNLYRLDYWLRARNLREPPNAGGIWGQVITQVVRLHRRKRFHKQRLLDVFRELRHSTAAMPDGVIVLNANNEIVWFNRMAMRLLSLRRRVDIGLRISNLVRDPRFVQFLDKADFSAPLEVPHANRDGLALSFQVVPYGRQQRLLLVRDVSRQVALESMRKDFVATASHELRSPLTVITGYLETLVQDTDIDPMLQGPLGEMRRQSDRMNAIVRDLLELSRLDAGDAEAAYDTIDVAGLLAMLKKDVTARPLHPQISLAIESPAGLLGDEAEVHSVFANLVENAVKYTPDDGQVSIRWWVDAQGEAHLSVTDTGMGIPAEHIPRLTERFYRVDAGRARTTGGTGLGLAIVKHALEHHGARLHIESEEGVGSTFSCYFPARRVWQGGRQSTIDAAR